MPLWNRAPTDLDRPAPATPRPTVESALVDTNVDDRGEAVAEALQSPHFGGACSGAAVHALGAHASATVCAMPEQSPDRFAGPIDVPDRYQLLDRRSAGGEGEIWSAVEQHTSFSFRYAIKIIHAEHLADAETSFAAPVLSTPAAPPTPPPVTYGPPPPPPIPYGPPPFPGKPQQKKKSGGKIAAIIGGALALVLVACCGLSWLPSIFGNGTGLGSSSSPSISVDRKVPPPSVQALQPTQVSVAQIIKVTGGETSDISQASDGTPAC